MMQSPPKDSLNPDNIQASKVGLALAEVYRLVYDGPRDTLHGFIMCKDQVNCYQCLFKEENLHVEHIHTIMLNYQHGDTYNFHKGSRTLESSAHIIPNSPIKSSIHAKEEFSLTFYMFDHVLNLTIKYPYCRTDKLCVPRTKIIITKDGFRYLTVLYAIFNNAVEAIVKVTLNNCSVPFHLSGVIAARTSAIEEPAYSSLIFCKEHENAIKVWSGDDIVVPLLRDVVVVPLEHNLILEISLKGEDKDNKDDSDEMVDFNCMMVENYLIFKAEDDGKRTESISCSKGELKVEVTWRRGIGGIEAQAQDN